MTRPDSFMSLAVIPEWTSLSDDAQRTLIEIAGLFARKESATVELTIHQGGKRSCYIRTDMDSYTARRS